MTFTAEQVKLLSEPLDRSHVKEREQAGRRLSYIEGWHAIAEANRIFGFDGWTTQTVQLDCVNAASVQLGKPPNTYPGHAVSYIARVCIEVDGIVREGVGAGHGRDRDLGLAHESAAKEAETDARKRALMTFGNPFGLALYDKEQRNVSDGHEAPSAERQSEPVRKEHPAARTQAHEIDPDDSKTWPFDMRTVVPFGKFKGTTWAAMLKAGHGSDEHSWMEWMLHKLDASDDPRDKNSPVAKALRPIVAQLGPFPREENDPTC